MSIFTKVALAAMTIAAAECTVVLTSGNLNVFSPFDLTPGVNVLIISGVEISGDFAHPRPCASVGVFAGGRFVNTRVDLEPQGDGWIGRSISPSDGDIVITLRTVGPPVSRRTVSGTLTGHGISVVGTPGSAPSLVRIVFDPASNQTIDGSGETIGQFVNGNITGGATFIDAAGRTSRCDWMQWSLQPLPDG